MCYFLCLILPSVVPTNFSVSTQLLILIVFFSPSIAIMISTDLSRHMSFPTQLFVCNFFSVVQFFHSCDSLYTVGKQIFVHRCRFHHRCYASTQIGFENFRVMKNKDLMRILKLFFLNSLHDRKMSVLGLCALMSMIGQRPAEITESASKIIPAALLLFQGLKRAYASKYRYKYKFIILNSQHVNICIRKVINDKNSRLAIYQILSN